MFPNMHIRVNCIHIWVYVAKLKVQCWRRGSIHICNKKSYWVTQAHMSWSLYVCRSAQKTCVGMCFYISISRNANIHTDIKDQKSYIRTCVCVCVQVLTNTSWHPRLLSWKCLVCLTKQTAFVISDFIFNRKASNGHIRFYALKKLRHHSPGRNRTLDRFSRCLQPLNSES